MAIKRYYKGEERPKGEKSPEKIKYKSKSGKEARKKRGTYTGERPSGELGMYLKGSSTYRKSKPKFYKTKKKKKSGKISYPGMG